MASPTDSVWAVDLGSCALKALRVSAVGQAIQVTGFEVIPHAKILSGKGISALEREELIAISIRQLVQRIGLTDEPLIISVSGQSSFARFVTLPPVEAKKVPEIVRFEAMQQIPFDINEVQWDWQLISPPDSQERRVGLFAVKNEVVNKEIERFTREDLSVAYVQMAPMALYNWLMFERPELMTSEDRPVVVLNIGAECTDLVVCTNNSIWQRSILLGGNAFTEAIADAFKISFEKAEKLKRTAAVSKYARQILQAMKPVFTDLVSEVQKSLGFYTSSNPNARFARVVAMGGGTRLRGLVKYLQQSLQLPVERPDAFKRLPLASNISAAKFHENVPEMAVAYGLAIQGLGQSRLQNNLLPRQVARSLAWAEKTKYFYAAAGLLLVTSLLALGRMGLDVANYNRNEAVRAEVANVISRVQEAQQQLDQERSRGDEVQQRTRKVFERFLYRDTVPRIYRLIMEALPNAKNNPTQAGLYQAFANGDIEAVKAIPRKDRKQIFLTSLTIRYDEDLETARFEDTEWMQRGMQMGYGAMPGRPIVPDARVAPVIPESTGAPEPNRVSGFLVMMEGYSPYRDIGELLDPPGVDNQPQRWGLVTRLMHLDTIEPNCPFVLLDKGNPRHFLIDKGPVDPNNQSMPKGIGVPLPTDESLASTQRPLIDPMTGEIISRSFAVRPMPGRPPMGRPAVAENDYWFVLKFKLAWKDAPKPPSPPVDLTAAGAIADYGRLPAGGQAGPATPGRGDRTTGGLSE